MELTSYYLSPEDSEAIYLAYENYVDDECTQCMDPFDIIAQLEEELGYPLALS